MLGSIHNRGGKRKARWSKGEGEGKKGINVVCIDDLEEENYPMHGTCIFTTWGRNEEPSEQRMKEANPNADQRTYII